MVPLLRNYNAIVFGAVFVLLVNVNWDAFAASDWNQFDRFVEK